MSPNRSDGEDRECLNREAYQRGMTAAENGRSADTCPFATGARRKHWLAGFFAAKALPEKTGCKNVPAPRRRR